MTDRRFNHQWTPEREAALERMWHEGVSAAEIAAQMDTTVGAILDRRGVIGLPKRLNPGGWSNAQIETLRKLWMEGKSAAEIALVLRGKSRNAVIGKVHRLGLSDAGRAKPGPVRTYAPRLKAPSVPRSAHPRPQNKPGAVFGAYQHERDFAKAEIVRAKKTEAGIKTVARVSAGAGVESPNARPFMEANSGCKWPIGSGLSMLYCCNPKSEGSRSYCSGHHAVSISQHQPVLRPREASRLTRFDRVERDVPRPARVERTLWDDARLEAA